ncbi:MAG: dockerin type I domain-containing protein [Bdellovibrionota bacterium]
MKKRTLIVESLSARLLMAVLETLSLPTDTDYSAVHVQGSLTYIAGIKGGRLVGMQLSHTSVPLPPISYTYPTSADDAVEELVSVLDGGGAIGRTTNLGYARWGSPTASPQALPLGDSDLLDQVIADGVYLVEDQDGLLAVVTNQTRVALPGLSFSGSNGCVVSGMFFVPGIDSNLQPIVDIVRPGSVPEVTAVALAKPSTLTAEDQYVGAPTACIVDPITGQVTIVASYLEPSTSNFPSGVWDGGTGTYLNDASAGSATLAHATLGTALIQEFGGDYKLAFFDAWAPEVFAVHHGDYALRTGYDLKQLFQDNGISATALGDVITIGGNGLNDLELLVIQTKPDGSSEQALWSVTSKPWTNPADHLDVNADGHVSPIDALIGINRLNSVGSGFLRTGDPLNYYYDVNGDGYCSPLDVLWVINFLNQRSQGGGEGEAAPTIGTAATDRVFEQALWSPDIADELYPTSTRRIRR